MARYNGYKALVANIFWQAKKDYNKYEKNGNKEQVEKIKRFAKSDYAKDLMMYLGLGIAPQKLFENIADGGNNGTKFDELF